MDIGAAQQCIVFDAMFNLKDLFPSDQSFKKKILLKF